MSTPSLTGKVCLVTGATRGIGRGIALQLGQAGATVYITGRTLKKKSPDAIGSSLEETAQEIKERGGKCIPVQCDHSNDDDVEKLFERIKTEQNGQLDVLVNNAYAGVKVITDNVQAGNKFWEAPPTMWDDINNVGLRNHYFCTVYATRMMLPKRQGLIVNVSSGGGLRYLFNVPYGVGKEACDRMAADCAFELRGRNVAVVSLWPGAVSTETIQNMQEEIKNQAEPITPQQKKTMDVFANAESVEFSGKSIAYLANDPDIMQKSGKILMTAELADEYKFMDIDGTKPLSMRSVRYLTGFLGYKKTASWIPGWLKIPYWMVALSGSKF